MRVIWTTLLAVWLVAVACETPLGPVPPWVLPYWVEAQGRLVAAGWTKAVQVPPEEFRFVGHDGETYRQGGRQVYGHFSPPRTIHYARETPHVVIHEAGHGILYRLGVGCWRTWEHAGGCTP